MSTSSNWERLCGVLKWNQRLSPKPLSRKTFFHFAVAISTACLLLLLLLWPLPLLLLRSELLLLLLLLLSTLLAATSFYSCVFCCFSLFVGFRWLSLARRLVLTTRLGRRNAFTRVHTHTLSWVSRSRLCVSFLWLRLNNFLVSCLLVIVSLSAPRSALTIVSFPFRFASLLFL